MAKLDGLVETLIDRLGMAATAGNGDGSVTRYKAGGLILAYSPEAAMVRLWHYDHPHWNGMSLTEYGDNVEAHHPGESSDETVARWAKIDHALDGDLQRALMERAYQANLFDMTAKMAAPEWRLAKRIGDYVRLHTSEEIMAGG